eukprot:CAMPEP_0183427594 /NCGR_PEP_ID=MMETSP0370-20130417/42792_1 /TAXON_ID=268820 /ORGANISM="Peridinium aciculiferum, Strain PAER-2" /LENGTH=58 /DNA_ID=CAMNT_0025612201 /DNA_START=73 /DNA_END=246 /DNA_ORIENTATION=-
MSSASRPVKGVVGLCAGAVALGCMGSSFVPVPLAAEQSSLSTSTSLRGAASAAPGAAG